jgi:hypothetical protein
LIDRALVAAQALALSDIFARLSPQLGEPEPVLVPRLDQDVQDLAGLSLLAACLFS